MLQKTEGIVLKATKYSETSLICAIYTREWGLRTYIINGVRRKKSRIAPGLLQPMALVDLVVYHHEEKDINRIKEIKPSYVYQRLPFDVTRGAVGLFLTEVLQKTLREPEPHPMLFDFLTQSYQYLDRTEQRVAHYSLWWLVQYAAYLGLKPTILSLTEESVFDYSTGKILAEAPDAHHYYFSTHHTHLMAALLELNAEASAELELTAEDRRGLLRDLLRYYEYHIDGWGPLNSLTVLQAVFA